MTGVPGRHRAAATRWLRLCVAEHNHRAQRMYERAGFAARVASRHRSSFVGEVADFAGDRRLTYVKAETVTDVQLSYEFQSGFAKGLSLLFQANNVTDEPYVRYRDTPANEVERKKFGANYLFGLNFKL